MHLNRSRALLGALVVALAVAPFVLPPGLLTPLTYIGLYAIVCLGLVLLTGMVGITSFGQAAFVGISAYTTAWLTTQAGWSPWLSAPAAIALCAASAALLGVLTIRLSGHYLVLGTIAWGLSLYYLFGYIPELGGYNGMAGVPTLHIPGLDVSPMVTFHLLIWSLIGLFFLAAYNLLDSRSGRAVRSLRDSVLTESLGIPGARLKVEMFVWAAALAGVTGWLSAHYLSVVNPGPFGIHASIDYIFMAVVGGTGSLAGALVGPAVVEILRNAVRDLLPGIAGVGGNFESIIFAVVVIVILQSAGGGLMKFFARWLPTRRVPVAPASAEPLARRTQPAVGSPLLQVSGLTRRFGGLVAVNEVGFEMAAGEILAVIGPNGAGKSTLFNLLTGVLAPSGGEVRLQGQTIGGRSARTISGLGVARTFQHVRLRPDMTVLENAALGAWRRSHAGTLKAMLRLERAEEARCLFEAQTQLDRVGLGHLAGQLAGALPLGQQRVLEIARALAADPMLLLLDEPAAGLRSPEKKALAALLRQLREQGVSVLLVEHDMDFVMNLVDRAVVMQFGTVICVGTPDAVRADPRVIEAYLGGDDLDDEPVGQPTLAARPT